MEVRSMIRIFDSADGINIIIIYTLPMDSNPWLDIPLEDYERHMSHHLVGQSTLLNSLTKKYLVEIKPETIMFPGNCRW